MSTTRSPLYRRVRDDAAFTLLEVIVALSLLGILLVPLTASFITAIRETARVDQRLAQSADAQRIAAAWTKDVHTVASNGYNTPGKCVGQDGVLTNENTLVSFEWDNDSSISTPIMKADWVVKGTGSTATLVRRVCRAGLFQSESLLADSFGVNGTPVLDIIHSATGPGHDDFCNNDTCTISISGAFEYSLTVARRVTGTGNPSIIRPDAPVITGVLGGNGTLTVVWLPVVAALDAPPVVGYRIWLSATPGGPEIDGQVILPADTDTVGQFTGLVNGTSYWVQAKALTAPEFEDSLPSVPPVEGIPAPVVPGPPTNASAVRGDTAATVSWDWSDADNGGSPITGWKVRARLATTNDLAKEQAVASPGARSTVVTGLENGTQYIFNVTAVNALGDGAESEATNGVIPCGGPFAPDKPSIEDAGSVRITVGWNAPLANGCAITSYEIEAAAFGLANSLWPTDPVAEGTDAPTTFTTPSLQGQTEYTFRVRGLNSSGIPGAWSVPSESISSIGPPIVPALNATAVPQEDTVNEATNGPNINNVLLSWDPVPNTTQFNGGSPVLGYRIHVTPPPVDNQSSYFFQGAGTFGGARLSQSYGNLKQIDDKGTPDIWDDAYIDYEFSIGAENAISEAAVADRAVMTNVRAGGRPTASPTNVSFSGYNLKTDRSGIRVRWDELANTTVNNGDNPLIGYMIRWRPANINGLTSWYVSGSNTTQADLGDFLRSTTYDFQVVAVNSLGNTAATRDKGAGISQIYSVTSPSPVVAPPSSSIILTRPAGPTGNRLNINFPAFTSGPGSNPPTYVASCTVPAEPAVPAVAFPSLTPGDNLLDSPSLTNGKAWRCTITATATYPSGSADVTSVQSSGTATPSTTAAAPTGLAVTAISGGKAHIGWTPVPPASNGGDGPASYVVSVSPALGGFPKTVTGAASTGVDTDDPVPFGTTYTFSVVSRNVAGDSAAATTTYASSQSVPTVAPTGVDYTPLATTGSVKITWTPIATTPLATGNSPVINYVVTIRNTAGGATTSVTVPGASASETTFTGFAQVNGGGTAFNDYQVTVAAVNALGSGPIATLNGVRTGGVPLVSVADFTINPRAYKADGSLRLNWTAIDFNNPKQTGGSADGGEAVSWSFDGGATWSAEIPINGFNQSSTALGFSNPNAAIQLRVRLYNTNGTNPVAPAIVTGRTPSGPVVPGSGVSLIPVGNPGSGLLRITFGPFNLANNNPTHYDYAMIGYSVVCDSPGYPTQNYSWTVSGTYDLTGLTSNKLYTCVLTASAASYEAEPLNRVAVTVTRSATSA